MTPPTARPFWLRFCICCGTFHDETQPCPSQFVIAAVRTLAGADYVPADLLDASS